MDAHVCLLFPASPSAIPPAAQQGPQVAGSSGLVPPGIPPSDNKHFPHYVLLPGPPDRAPCLWSANWFSCFPAGRLREGRQVDARGR